MTQSVELHDWSAWKWSNTEVRLCGYLRSGENHVKSVVSGPIVMITDKGIWTENNIYFKPMKVLEKVHIMDTMYVVQRYCEVNYRNIPKNVTEEINEKVVLEAMKEVKEEKTDDAS